jgi:hypothetical protein
MKKILSKAKLIISFANFSCLLSDNSAGQIARKLSVFLGRYHSTIIIRPHISPGTLKAAVQRRILTPIT